MEGRPNHLGQKTMTKPWDTQIDWFTLFDTAMGCIMVHDAATGDTIYANKQASAVYGYSQKVLLEKRLPDLFALDSDYTEVRALKLMQKAVDQGGLITEWRIRNCAGEEYPIEIRASQLTGKSGQSLVVVQFHDISRRKRLEAELQRKEQRYRHILAESFGGILIVDESGTVQYAASSIEAILGYVEADILGQSVTRLVHPDDQPRFDTCLQNALSHYRNRSRVELRLKHATGAWRVFVIHCRNSLHDDDINGVLVHFRDVTTRVEAQREATKQREETQHLARYKTLAEMGSAVAHELNHPVASIRNYAAGTLKRLDGPDWQSTVTWALSKIEGQALRATRIIESIRNFNTMTSWQKQDYSIEDIFNDIEEFLDIIAKKNDCQIIYDIKNPNTQISCDKILIEQVFINLSLNAIQAMTEKDEGQRLLSIVAKNFDQKNVQFDFVDQGHGMSNEAISTLFKDRFTTKKSGTGLGLILSHSIIERHDGHIEAHSKLDKGTTISVTLPRNP